MDKAKAYDEALERARKQRDDYQKELDKTDKNSQLAAILRGGISAIELAFPELTESEDEKIRKSLIDFLTDIKEISESGRSVWAVRKEDAEMCKSSIAYLEKQKEQKPVDDKAFEEWVDSWFKEHKEKAYPQITMDEKEFKNFCRGIKNMYQQKSDWNEEDEEIWFALITFFKTYLQKYPPACKDEKIQANRILKWLNTTIKSFRLHYRWKPSKEKMDALKNVAYGTYQNGDGPALRELYEQLLKLGVKEEPEYYQHFDPDC